MRIVPALVLCSVVLGTMVGCSDGPEPTSSDLVANLAILKDQQGFTGAQVRCVADHVRTSLSEGELKQFDDDLAAFARSKALDSMSPTSQQALTGAITKCAVAPG